MEGRNVFRALMWSMAAFFGWLLISQMIWGPPVPPPETERTSTTQPGPAEEGPAPAATSPATSAAVPAPATPPAAGASALTPRHADAAEALTLGNVSGGEQSPFRMLVELTSVGAAVSSVTLSDFAEQPQEPPRYRLAAPVEDARGRQFTSLAIEKLTIDGNQEIPLQDAVWTAQKTTMTDPPGEAATFTLDLVDPEGRPALRLTRRYELPAQPLEEKRPGRYDLETTLTVENLDQVARRVIVTLHGPVGVTQADPRMDSRAVSVGIKDSDGVALLSKQFSKLAGEDQESLNNLDDDQRLWWAAVGNKFFAWIVTPLTPDREEGPDYIADVQGIDLDGSGDDSHAVTLRLICKTGSIPAGGKAELPFSCYLGPKNRIAFADDGGYPDYSRRNYYLLISRMYTSCSFTWLAELMIRLLATMHAVIPSYGIAIIILVLVVRVLLHPITKKGQVNMMKMQKEMGKLQPKLQEIKKKYANDRARMNQEMQKLYQSEGINPMGQMMTCLPMMLQMPIWIALYTSLNNNIVMRHEPFLWIKDLTAADALYSFGGDGFMIPLLSGIMGPITSLNILPILWAIAMYAQQKLMPKPKQPEGGSSPQADQAAQMQKMMPIMSIFFALLFYNAPSGLTLYIMASTVFGMLEQWRIREHIKVLDAQGGEATDPQPRGPRGPLWLQRIRQGITNRWKNLQKQAEEAQRVRGGKK